MQKYSTTIDVIELRQSGIVSSRKIKFPSPAQRQRIIIAVS